MPTWVYVLIAIIVLLALVGVVLGMRYQRQQAELRRAAAEELRARAGTHDEAIVATRPAVEQAEQAARERRLEANRADQLATAAEQHAESLRRDLEVEEAHQEDVLREADDLDPDVDPSSEEYRPGKRRAATPTDSPSLSQTPPRGEEP